MSSNLSDLEKMLDATVADALQSAGEYAVEQARSTNLFHTGSKFKEQIITQPVSKNKQIVWSQADWSSYLEEGNNQGGPFIYPKTAKALRFIMAGQTIFAKHVRAHGPLPFMTNAAVATDAHFHTLWQHSLDKHFK